LLRLFCRYWLGWFRRTAETARTIPFRTLMNGSRLDREQLRIIRDDSALHRFLRVISRSGERCITRVLLGVDPEKPPGVHTGVTGAFNRTEEGMPLVHEFEIFCQFVSLSGYFNLTAGPRSRVLMFRRTAIAALLLAIGSSVATAQPPAAAITVVDGLSGQRIANVDIVDLKTGARSRTNSDGQARFAWPLQGNLTIRLRQVGYTAATHELRRDSNMSSFTIPMSRVHYVLPSVRTTAASACSPPPDSASAQLSATALEQIRLGAERYEAFRSDYPFRATIKRRTATVANGKVTRFVESTGEVLSENWGDKYRSGQVIQRAGIGFSIPLLFLSTLADEEFWRNHCFVANGVEDHDGTRLLRLDFEPVRNVRSPDWKGSAFIDSATSMLMRIDFHLVRLGRNERITRLEGYTKFKSPSPFFVIPDSTVAGWWKRSPDNGDWGLPDVAQSLYTVDIEYLKSRPPADSSRVFRESGPRENL
jgi:hypothetical protein